MAGFNWKWFFISMLCFIVAQAVLSVVFGIVGVLTLGFGFLFFLILKPVVYWVGGYVTGKLSPGITIREPAVGALVVSAAGLLLDAAGRGDGRSTFGLIISGIIAYFCALWGARAGETRE